MRLPCILQYSKFRLLSRLIIPSALPNILLGIRLSVGASWLLLAVAEMMGASAGGRLYDSRRTCICTDGCCLRGHNTVHVGW
ncbi:ABC transporter permease subunit [Paenibacillus amylolyticus]|nr:ABC transporter permease subunit [Paenibacillus amylolyticus]